MTSLQGSQSLSSAFPVIKMASPKERILILVETPFQLLCACEYVRSHEAEYKVCIRNSGRGANDQQTKNLAEQLGMRVDQIIMAAPGDRLATSRALLKFMMSFTGRYNKVLLGTYFSGLLKNFAKLTLKTEIVLLDDGVATLLADRLIREREPLRYSVFSIFNLDPKAYVRYERHAFENIRIQAKTYPSLVDGESAPEALFIGQKLIDIGVIDPESYFRTISWAAERIDGRNLYYIPHRNEGAEHTAMIAEMPKVKVLHSDVAIEWLSLRNGWEPKYIFSVISTALITLSTFYPDAKSYALYPAALSRDFFPHWDLVSEYVAGQHNIEVVDDVA